MCFTVNVNIVKEELEKRFNLPFLDHENYRPSYYFHAHSLPELPVLANQKNDKEINLMKWGLIPNWTRATDEANKIRYMTFNARSESITEKPSFSGSFHNKRCVIPVRGFFEWQHAAGKKLPWYIYMPDTEIMMLAGLYDIWKDPETNEEIRTFTIITSKSNNLLSEIHNTKKRMPVILNEEFKELWLDPDSNIPDLTKLFEPYPDKYLKAHTISPLISSRSGDKNTPDLIKPYKYPEQSSLF